jgi:hypothetical protein
MEHAPAKLSNHDTSYFALSHFAGVVRPRSRRIRISDHPALKPPQLAASFRRRNFISRAIRFTAVVCRPRAAAISEALARRLANFFSSRFSSSVHSLGRGTCFTFDYRLGLAVPFLIRRNWQNDYIRPCPELLRRRTI